MSSTIIVPKDISSVNTAHSAHPGQHSDGISDKMVVTRQNENHVYLHTEFSSGHLVTAVTLKAK
jgi:hypothetical protein